MLPCFRLFFFGIVKNVFFSFDFDIFRLSFLEERRHWTKENVLNSFRNISPFVSNYDFDKYLTNIFWNNKAIQFKHLKNKKSFFFLWKFVPLKKGFCMQKTTHHCVVIFIAFLNRFCIVFHIFVTSIWRINLRSYSKIYINDFTEKYVNKTFSNFPSQDEIVGNKS